MRINNAPRRDSICSHLRFAPMPAQRGAGRSLYLGLGDAQPTRIGEIFLLRREQAHLVNGSGLRQRADAGIVEHDLMRLGLTGLRGTRYNLRTFEIFSLISRRSLEAGAEHSLSLSKIDQPSRGREEQLVSFTSASASS